MALSGLGFGDIERMGEATTESTKHILGLFSEITLTVSKQAPPKP